MNRNECKHGRLKRQCPECDLLNEMGELRDELAAEREKVRELEESLQYASTKLDQAAEASKLDRQQLAASKLSEQRLREALETAKPYMDQAIEQLHAALAGYKPHVHKQADDDAVQVDAALSTTIDTAALKAYVAEKVEPWKKDALRWRRVENVIRL